MKTARELERHLKGIASYRRIEILLIISKKEGITLDQIAEGLDCNMKTISEHTRKLSLAGLVNKKYEGLSVHHTLSPYGKKFIHFIKLF
ncbi:MAG: helix-turn-helix domain-containing protein [Patescibacteria group bacterium]